MICTYQSLDGDFKKLSIVAGHELQAFHPRPAIQSFQRPQTPAGFAVFGNVRLNMRILDTR